MSPPTVLIVGCGVAGPVMACLLKQKGYRPIVFEKVKNLGDAGSSLMLMPNGMKVLNLVGISGRIARETTPLTHFIQRTSSGQLLGESDLPTSFTGSYQQPANGVKRTWLNLELKKMLLEADVDVREGWKLVDIAETDDGVTATFDNGESVSGSFLIGCDGIRSSTRDILQQRLGFAQGPPEYTGLVQVAGLSKASPALLERAAMRNWYGQGLHCIAYPISPTHISWAVTLRQDLKEAETWKLSSPDEIQAETAKILSAMDGWDPAVRQMVSSAERLIKFGLYDREELTAGQWYSKRCVLIGDAAHPTSPHLGQGANQALEDCYYLSSLLPTPPTTQDTTSSLPDAALGAALSEDVFRPFAEKRQQRTSALVRKARAIGELRTASDPNKCEKRNSDLVAIYSDRSTVAAEFDDLLRGPF